MAELVERLKKIIPPIAEQLPGGLTQASASELAGPCPVCSGTDRFRVFLSEDRAWCRKCNWSGDRIDLARMIENCTITELARRRLPPEEFADISLRESEKRAGPLTPSSTAGQGKGAKAPHLRPEVWNFIRYTDPRDPWRLLQHGPLSEDDRIQAHTAALIPFLSDVRKLSPEVIRAAVAGGSLAYHLYAPGASECNEYALDYTPCAAFKFTTPGGALRGVELVAFDKKPITKDRGSKKFVFGSELTRGAFFAGQRLKGAGLVVLVESCINALSVAAILPEAAAVATGSASCRQLLKRLAPHLKGKRVVCAFDNDIPGQKATALAGELIPGVATVNWPLGTPEGFDPNDLLKAGQGTEIARLIAAAQPIHVPNLAADSAEVDEVVRELNRQHAFVMLGGKAVVMNEGTDPETGQPAVTFSSARDFHLRYAPRRVVLRGEQHARKVSEIWFDSPRRREYKGLVFQPNPNRDLRGYYNLWRGFAVTPRPGDWSIFKNFIFEIICGHRPEINSWVLAWMARLCQDPGGDRPGTAIVLRSEAKGTGKSSFANIFGSIFGPHYIQLTSSLQIVGRFNSHLQGKVLAFADEASWGGDRNAEGVLKNLITEPYANIELKGRDLIRVRNHINLIFASNSTWVVPAGAGERRFLVLDVLPDRKGDTRFWKGMYEHMTRGGGIEAMFHDLLKIDTSTENLRYAPRTDALFDQILAGMSQNIVRAFWLETLKDGKHSFTPDSLRPCAGGTADWPTVILKDKIYEDFISFVKLSLHRYHAPSHREEFFADLKKNVDLSNFRPRINGERLCCLRIPVLEEARRQFEQIIGQPIPWVEEDEES